MTRQQIASQVARDKTNNPEKFCPVAKCLYRTSDGSRCPRHKFSKIYADTLAEIVKNAKDIYPA